ncbi:hypothetical protein F7731_12085 [Cytobacillus depressus]|uniref:Tissue inhibitor of metalloproteinase n=1 Tax=Cytobacillus depressus TaxID=1602942 RepID=A0A6L3V538_9BACI|nr:hypothetical protein [Cytobacillus depressus]KAB2336229.1 hypothetical protein F7731_12085 [Cytobacillus depressus]
MENRQSISRKATTWLLLLSICTCVAVFYIPTSTYACSCAEPVSVKSELSHSKVVFSGKVLSVKNKRSLNGYVTKDVIFEVSQTWKGVKESQIQITTGLGGGDCGIEFKKGEDYLVYGRDSDIYGKKQLVTLLCDRTVELASAKEDLGYLGDGKPPTKQIDSASDNSNMTFLFRTFVIVIVIVIGGIIGFFSWKRINNS